jgi:hypothetical protein
MKQRTIVLQLLYFALLEIREALINEDLRRALMLVDVFHNIPSALNTEENHGGDGSITLTLIRTRADERGFGNWVTNALTRNVSE